jgi:ribosomal-protein-alanine N-acetyltransferase
VASEAPELPGVVIRDMRPADLSAVVAIERSSFPTPWSERAFRSLLLRPDAFLLVADLGGRVIGHAAAWFIGSEAELADLAVDPSMRRRGVGGALLDAVRARACDRGADALSLQVRVSNVTALRLYAAAGFRHVGRRRAYYHSPREDALVLRLELPWRAVIGGGRRPR